jgi:predicted nucleic acid-binding protein
MLVLLDTNIVLDFVLARTPFFNEAIELFTRLQNNEFDAFVSAITPINVFYTTRK